MKQHVILLHGLARSSRSMNCLSRSLTRSGFSVDNCPYPSQKLSIEMLSEKVFEQLIERIPDCDKVHFVTHSLGGILLRYYLSQHQIPKLGRVVMLAPPNHGTEVVDRMKHWPLFRWFNGPAGQQLGTGDSGLPHYLPDANFELGIIAGNRSVNLYLSTLIPKPNDGKVSVDSTKLAGMSAHLILPVSHPFIMRNRQVCHQTIQFLQYGKFN